MVDGREGYVYYGILKLDILVGYEIFFPNLHFSRNFYPLFFSDFLKFLAEPLA